MDVVLLLFLDIYYYLFIQEVVVCCLCLNMTVFRLEEDDVKQTNKLIKKKTQR